jgi:hypothetical protein
MQAFREGTKSLYKEEREYELDAIPSKRLPPVRNVGSKILETPKKIEVLS